MSRFYFLLLWLGVWVNASAADLYREPFRPQFHFTPATNWMNDPNGLVFYDGEYHLFYQFNPFGNKWGHMSWGHAVSPDLVHWEHLPVALSEENDVMIFSGSAVVDWQNTSGFGRNGKPPLVAIYTGHYTKKPLQNQNIAYSNDRGRTWTKYAGNPVLDIGEKDFRDPKVFWHEASRRWIMTVAWPLQHKVRFYASPDLKQWTHLSDFGPGGFTKGIWECPDLFPLKAGNDTRWVLVVNVGSGAPAGGSGCQYFVGNFDGREFVLDSSFPAGQDAALWADYGRDFYAAVSWSDIPKRDGRRLWLGWMSNWEYANDVPTAPWRSAMSLPRELALRKTPDGLRLVQEPARELRKLRSVHHRFGRKSFPDAATWVAGRELKSELLEVNAEFAITQTTGDFGLKILNTVGEETLVRVSSDGKFAIDRTKSGNTNFHRKFPGIHEAKVALRNGQVSLHLFVDTSSLEVFGNNGEVVLTDLILPASGGRKLALFSHGEPPKVKNLEIWELNSAWKKP